MKLYGELFRGATVNGTHIDLETVIKRFQPKLRYDWCGGFKPSDICTPKDLEERLEGLYAKEQYDKKNGYIPENSSVYCPAVFENMGWEFLAFIDGYGEAAAICFAPLSGKVEIEA